MASVLVGNELISPCGHDSGRVSLAFLAIFNDVGGGVFLSLLPGESQGRRQRLPPTCVAPPSPIPLSPPGPRQSL